MHYLYIFLILLITSCNSKKSSLTAQQVIDNTIAFSGVSKVSNSKITFKFRDILYTGFFITIFLGPGFEIIGACPRPFTQLPNKIRDVETGKPSKKDYMI